ncbi:HBR143Cp [Eremothecium sinecaudum]|uniref:HBR143Cp n=1 Tax=Eremothecium sinecaudum TaxID=45286 RepID=A0A109UWY8_9SACH|nr:HBR143Cp [Eremothecium sinecaudum]AMD19044.1 HBR143Cp [Eremothecium sinecaudum]
MSEVRKSRLILVPCHSIWKESYPKCQAANLGQLPEHWYLAPFQLEGNDHIAFIKHAVFGIRELVNDLVSGILIFSGSQTKKEAGPISEACSYYSMAQKLLTWIELGKTVPDQLKDDIEIIPNCKAIINTLQDKYRITVAELFEKHISTEVFALDSFDNLLYSIGRFHELTSYYPVGITIVGFGFKKERFLNYHAKAIDFPSERIKYISKEPIPDYSDPKAIEGYFTTLKELEKKNALCLFASDWYGTRDTLALKKNSRNPFKKNHRYSLPLHHLQNEDFKIIDDQQYYNQFISGKMPWSVS